MGEGGALSPQPEVESWRAGRCLSREAAGIHMDVGAGGGQGQCPEDRGQVDLTGQRRASEGWDSEALAG